MSKNGENMTTDPTRPNADGTPNAPDFDTGKAILRLLVGLTLEGVDELGRRLREWETEVTQQDATASGVESTASGADTAPLSDGDRLSYALIGMAFAARQRIEDDLQNWLQAPGRAVQGMIDTADDLANNPLLRPLIQPVKERAETLSQQVNDEVERWIAIGQDEEAHSRAVARIAVPEVINEIINHLADNPELQDLVQQQSVGLAGEAIDSVREVTVTADAVLERIVRGLLRRKPRPELPPPGARPMLPEPSRNGSKEPHHDEQR